MSTTGDDERAERQGEIGRLRGKPRRRRILAWDTEDDGAGHFVLGVVTDGTRDWRFTSKSKMRGFITSWRMRGAWLWAHNAEYDLASVFGPRFKGLTVVYVPTRFIAGRALIREREGRREYVTFGDSMNLTASTAIRSVADIGEYLGVPKLTPSPEAERLRRAGAPSEALFKYCQRDARIVWRFVSMLQDALLGLGCGLHCTIPAAAFELFRRKYLRATYHTPPRELLDLIRPAYYGGRVECFRVGRVEQDGKGPIVYADVNSMYPAVMVDLVVGDPDSARVLTEPAQVVDAVSGIGVTACRVRVPQMRYPPLPWRSPEGKLLFPVGEFDGLWENGELRNAIDRWGAEIVRPDWGVSYHPLGRVFREYVRKLYGVRQRGEAPLDLVAKLLLNSLYGKFGQRAKLCQYYSLDEFKARGGPQDGETVTEYRDMVLVETDEGYARHTNLIWALQVTAGARVRLHDLLVKYQALYCDTDSLFTFKRVKSSNRLGGLKVEKTCARVTFVAPKVYEVEERRITAKGFRRGSVKTLDDLWTGVTVQAPVRLREAVRRGTRPNVWRDQEKHLRREAPKRILVGGGETVPYLLGGETGYGVQRDLAFRRREPKGDDE